MIYVFGDSHRAFFTQSHPGSSTVATYDIFKSYALGAGTAYNFFSNRHAEVVNILQCCEIEATVLIVAGEIDCRLHIPKLHIKHDIHISELVENTVNHLMKSLIALRDEGYKPIAWGPHPTRHLEMLDYKPEWYAGDQQMRNQICMAFNGYLQQQTRKEGIAFATTFYTILKEYDTYTVCEEAYRDQLHLSPIMWPTVRKRLGVIYDNYHNLQ